MDKEKIKGLAAQCLAGLETVTVAGEMNHLQLVGVRRSLREIIKEADKVEATNVVMDTEAINKAVTKIG